MAWFAGARPRPQLLKCEHHLDRSSEAITRAVEPASARAKAGRAHPAEHPRRRGPCASFAVIEPRGLGDDIGRRARTCDEVVERVEFVFTRPSMKDDPTLFDAKPGSGSFGPQTRRARAGVRRDQELATDSRRSRSTEALDRRGPAALTGRREKVPRGRRPPRPPARTRRSTGRELELEPLGPHVELGTVER